MHLRRPEIAVPLLQDDAGLLVELEIAGYELRNERVNGDVELGAVVEDEALVRDADAALYSAKALGRDQVYVFRETGDEGAILGLDRFGASAPAGTIFKAWGFTAPKASMRFLISS